MLFLGDMSIPNSECGEKLIADMKACGVFDDQTIVVNLEGVLHHENPKDTFWHGGEGWNIFPFRI